MVHVPAGPGAGFFVKNSLWKFMRTVTFPRLYRARLIVLWAVLASCGTTGEVVPFQGSRIIDTVSFYPIQDAQIAYVQDLLFLLMTYSNEGMRLEVRYLYR